MPVSAMNDPFIPVSDNAINFEEVLRKLDDEFKGLPSAVVERFRFGFDGLNFDVRRVAQEGGLCFLVNATIGYLPFSIESAQRRDAIKAIVQATRVLPNVHFVIDAASKISAGALFDATRVVSPDFIFHPLMLFMQEARPFIRLIGKYLYAAREIHEADA
ncbi:MAG: hypothetical protein P4M13_08980 [Alphaproteobacteria bacterium]|nr:hypothetical protein [Alphaproteobacteria bacterium]